MCAVVPLLAAAAASAVMNQMPNAAPMPAGSAEPSAAASPPPSPAAAPTDVNVQAAQADERKKQMAASGMRRTLLTGPRGDLSSAPVQRKALLGQ